jgi:hypothetical protein
MANNGLSKKAAELVSRLRKCETAPTPLAEDFGYAAHIAPVTAVMEEISIALSRREMTAREAFVTKKEGVRIMREIRARIRDPLWEANQPKGKATASPSVFVHDG